MSSSFAAGLTRDNIISDQEGSNISERSVPGCVCLAVSVDAEFSLPKRVEGKRSMQDGALPMTEDTVLFMASATKPITTVAILQCVERGQIQLDDPVAPYLSELAEPFVIEGWQQSAEGKEEPVLRKAEGQVTLRQLLNHTSGVSAAIFDPYVHMPGI